ncbi:MAG TPA: ABC transporter permease [Vicinamibacterales bacterium]|nr:ABC transporter permease [Vicinamibacterales bacterium]
MQDWLFRTLVRLLPEEFRAGYARDMAATFRAERRQARSWGRILWLWSATIADLARTAPAEHLDILARDVRFAFRTMAARPLATAAAVLTLGLGLGANVAMFAAIDAVLLAPLPYRDPARLAIVSQSQAGGEGSPIGYLTFVDLSARARSFETLVAASQSTATLTGSGLEPERVNAMRVSRAYFDMLGVAPALGRTFTDNEDQPGPARRVVIVSDELWRRRFGADPSAVGRVFDIAGLPYRIVGVLPPRFEDLVAARMYDGAEVWFPLGYDPAASFACRTCQHLRVFGRLAPGVSVEAADRELDTLIGSLEREYPSEYHQAGAEVVRLSDALLGPVRPVLLVLWAGVIGLLLVACGNVANLLLLRASERSQEVAVRAALGVTRGRLARQLLTESLVLSLTGGLAGLVPAWAAVRLLAVAGPAQIPRLADAALDARAVAVALAITLASSMVFGLVPLRLLLRSDVRNAVEGAGRRTASSATWRVRGALVAVNVAMAALLLVGAGLLVRSVSGLLAVSPGIDPSGVLTMQVWAAGERFREGENSEQIAAAVRLYDDILGRARALPGVTAAAAVTTLPLGGGVDGYGFHIQGRPSANPDAAPTADRFVVTPGYFETLRTPLVRGRVLDERDGQGREPVVVVNQTVAESLFPGEDPIGHRVSLGPPTAVPRTIVGVVGDVRHRGLGMPVGYQVYVPQAQWAWAETFMTLVIRAEEPVAVWAAPMREIVRAVDPSQPVTAVRPYAEVVAESTGTRRFTAGLLTVFAGTALVMAIVGLYGALGVLVGQRRREIGVRIALGARARAIRRLVIVQGIVPVTAGLAAGLTAAALSVGALRSMLYNVEPLDPATFVTAMAVLGAGALAASLLPAWRASKIDPATTLRE